jgi:hypothetical protein
VGRRLYRLPTRKLWPIGEQAKRRLPSLRFCAGSHIWTPLVCKSFFGDGFGREAVRWRFSRPSKTPTPPKSVPRGPDGARPRVWTDNSLPGMLSVGRQRPAGLSPQPSLWERFLSAIRDGSRLETAPTRLGASSAGMMLGLKLIVATRPPHSAALHAGYIVYFPSAPSETLGDGARSAKWRVLRFTQLVPRGMV